MMNKKQGLLMLIIMTALVLASCGPAATPEPTLIPTPDVQEGKALAASRCTGCHDLNRITNASYDRAGWEKTVERMVLSGAQLDSQQKGLVVDYLTVTFPKE